MAEPLRREVTIVGGYHDGLTGDVDAVCVEVGFLVQEEGEWVYGYAWNGREVDSEGRPVFRPPSQRSA